jgi:hypothetical protein
MKINYYPRSKSISRSSKTGHQRNPNKAKTTMLPSADNGRWYILGGLSGLGNFVDFYPDEERWLREVHAHIAHVPFIGMGSYTSK